jgi:hypothetical protein
MPGLIRLELLTDFFNKIGHSLPSRPAPVPTDVRFAAKATELLCRAAKCREGPTGDIPHSLQHLAGEHA